MGSQIRIAQSSTDEEVFIRWIQNLYCIKSLPRLMPGQYIFPDELGKCNDRQQLVFSAENSDLIIQNIKPVLGEQDLFQVDPKIADGLCIEWSRTVQRKGNIIVVGGEFESRFYFNFVPNLESVKKTRRIYNNIVNYIKVSCPLCTTDKNPRYVSKDLSERIVNGNVQLVYPNGQKLDLRLNSLCSIMVDKCSSSVEEILKKLR